MRICLALLLFIIATGSTYGQRIPVRGIITDATATPIPGVTVTVKGTTQNAISKEDGTFLLNLLSTNNVTLVLSHTGFVTKEVKVTGTDDIKVSLVQSEKLLEDVIVVSPLGLTRKAKSIPYSSQAVDPEALTEARDVNITNGLAGKVAGIQVTTTGQPGSSSRVILRGDNSITGNNQPLWVVDGVAINNNMGEAGGNVDYGNGAQDLNPDDIESIEVLKGPNAAALYGSRAANGAILVTTKKGKIGDKTLGVSFNQNLMKYTVTQWPEYQNVYGEGSNGRLVADANRIVPGTNGVNMGTTYQSWGTPMLGQPFNNFSGQPHGYLPQPNNIRDMYRSPFVNTSNVSVSKADAISSFRASYTFTKANDVIENTNLKDKHNLSLAASRKIGSRISLDTRVLYTNDATKNRVVRNLDPSSPMGQFVWMSRSTDVNAFKPWKDANGNSLQLAALVDSENPFWSIYENENEDAHSRLIGGVTATVELTKTLRFRGQVSGDINNGTFYQYRELGGKTNPRGSYSNNTTSDNSWTYEGMLLYNKQLSTDFSLNGVIATSLRSDKSQGRSASLNALLVHDMPSISNSNTIPVAQEYLVKSKTSSVYGNVTLGFRDFLFLDITGRNDWSSTLPINKNSFFYPSIGGSFLFSEFLSKESIVSYGKLRASWARVGNSPQAYQLINTYSFGGLFFNNPSLDYTDQLKNADLKPEQTESKEIGADLAFFKNKLRISVSAYSSSSTNQIIRASAPLETGFTERAINAGEITNKGIEATVSATPIKIKKWSWDVAANFSTNKNMVVSLVPGVTRFDLGGAVGARINAEVGAPYGVIRGMAPYKVGDTILVGANGRVIQENIAVGNYRPDWLGSFRSTLRYGAFDLSIQATVKYGGMLYSATYARAMFQGTTIKSLEGRDEWLFSSLILGENGFEQRNVGQVVGAVTTRYLDSLRVKGLQYANAYLPKVVNGVQVVDKNGRLVPGDRSLGFVYPQLVNGNDKVTGDVPYVTFDATSVRISEMIFGYTVPQKVLNNAKFIKGARIAFVGRNLWQIYQNTPRGIDPESANSSGNAQGIEAGGSFPYAQWGFDLKLSF